HLFARQYVALDQQAADRDIRLAVAAVITDPDDSAGRHPHPAGALDFQEERIDRIIDPEDFQALPVQGAILDLGPAEARGIRGAAVDRGLKRAATPTRAIQGDLEIAGEQAVAVAIVAGQHRHEGGLEKLPGRLVVNRRHLFGGGAERAPLPGRAEIAAFRAPVKRRGGGSGGGRGTGFEKGRDGCCDGILAPPEELIILRGREGQPRRRLRLQQKDGDRRGGERQRQAYDEEENAPGARRHSSAVDYGW